VSAEPNLLSDRAAARAGRGLRGRLAAVNAALKEALDESIHGGARFAYVFGSGLVFLFVSQVFTGVALALYYVPSADHAHTTIAYVTKEVMSGAFLRSLHSYGSSAVVVVLVLHVAQTFLYGAYKGRRRALWVVGTLLFALMAGMAFTGYLLPWDQKAYYATAVGTNIMSEVPLVGEALKRLARGGNDMGTLTLSRFYVAHVFLLPAAIFLLVATHIYLFRRAGAAGPVGESPVAPRLPTEGFYPKQLLMDLAFALLLVTALGVLAYLYPVPLEPRANPADTQYLPRPEWYYRPMFQWLKYWQGPRAFVGLVVVPSVVVALFVGVPFIDRRLERRPLRRPVAVGLFLAILSSFVALGVMSYRDDRRETGVAAQLARQREETERFMREPFEPETAGATLAATNVALADPLAARGKAVYEAQSCNACHGDDAAGTSAGPSLLGVSAKYAPEQLTGVLQHPTELMTAGGMQPVELSDEEMRALVAYLRGLK
jgi:ubiquinol-cytochrome c reductase cytochrome b subunit